MCYPITLKKQSLRICDMVLTEIMQVFSIVSPWIKEEFCLGSD